MRVVSVPLVAPSTTNTMSTIPTALRTGLVPTVLGLSNLLVKLMVETSSVLTIPTIYRSPSSGWDEFAYYTSSSGKVLGVRNGDNLSYGYNTRVYFLSNLTIL